MIRVLFVDDDKILLTSLRNLFRQQRKVWDMRFAGGGDEALAEIAAAPIDVIVADMRMPGMNGAELLMAVAERLPDSARIILTGYAEPSALERARHVAHEVLGKPCSASVLRDAITRHASAAKR